jgi:carbamoyl-phosphate synthase large subunit
MNKKIAVTGLNAGDSPAPGVPVVRCLREHPDFRGKIVGLCYDAWESGILDPKMVDSAYLIPYPSAGKDALLERIRVIHRAEHLDVIIPNLDSELPSFIAIEKELALLGIRIFLPTQEQFKMRSKMDLPEFSKRSGIRSPKTVVVTRPDQVPLEELGYPCVVKGVFYEAHVAHSPEAAIQLIHQLARGWGYPILLQELVVGEEYNLAAVGDGNGKILAQTAMKKLVMTAQRKGWACVTIQNPKLAEFAERIVQELRWRGPIEIECIQSQADGEFYIIELNPRFPAWIYLAKAAGANLPYALLKLALGEELLTLGAARSGVVFTNYTTNLVTELATISSLFTAGELHYEAHL